MPVVVDRFDYQGQQVDIVECTLGDQRGHLWHALTGPYRLRASYQRPFSHQWLPGIAEPMAGGMVIATSIVNAHTCRRGAMAAIRRGKASGERPGWPEPLQPSPVSLTLETRAIAHGQPVSALRPEQCWQDAVTDDEVAVVMYALEMGSLMRYVGGRWYFCARSPYQKMITTPVSVVVREMVRTGLLRHLTHRLPDGEVHILVPARVHLRDAATGRSACQFPGEMLGPMRARLVDDLTLVDCLACEQA